MLKNPSYEELEQKIEKLEQVCFDQEQAGKVLQESETHTRFLFNISSLAIVLLDVNGIVLDCNPAFAVRFGMNCAKLTGNCVWDFIPEEVLTRRRKEVAAVFDTGEPFSGEDERQGVWNEYYINPVIQENGRVKAVAVEAINITRRVQYAMQLKESENRFNRLLRTMKDVVWAADLDGQMLYINPAVESVYGKKPLEFYADPKLWIKAVHPEDREGALGQIQLLFDKGTVENQYRIIRSDGQIRWVNDKKAVVYNKAGEPVQMGGITTDITTQILISQKNEKIMSDLGKRLKELDCIYKITNSLRLRKTLDQIFKDAVAFIPAGWQYPESTCCRVRFKGKDYISKNFKETPWKLSSDIFLSNQNQGHIEVFYLNKFPIRDKGPFLKEEQTLLNGISQTLTEACEYNRMHKINLKTGRALNLHSDCNKVIVHAVNESDLLNNVCRLIVETGQYRFTWIGFKVQDKTQSICPMAQHGFEQGFLDSLNITWADTDLGQSPVGKAIREQKTVVVKQISSYPDFKFWREKAMTLGYLSGIALPLISGHQVFGALVIYAAGEDAFGDEEVSLLEELANDLAYGIMAMRSRADLRRAEKFLRTEHDKLQSVLNGIGDTVYIADRDHVIEFQNDIFKKQFGELVGKKCYQAIFQLEAPCEFCLLQKAVTDNCIQHVETNFLNQKSYDIVFSPFQEGTGEIKSLMVIRDITEKKCLQAEVIRRGHLAALGELAAGVAHEINNPVTGIISIAEILTDKFYKLGGDKDIPERIIHEGERISNIVKNLLSFARDKKEEHSPVHVNDILQSTLELVEKQILNEGIHLSVNLPPDIPKIRARSQELQQVFLNIISNARYALRKKYPDPHENKIFQINGELIVIEEKNYVRLTFYDRGLGIPENLVARLADPFFSTKPQGEGTGLGLSISHGIIKNHGGKLWFESKEGEYTKVMVDLPIINGWSSKEGI
jgi:PAS domain S-box-containing protein